MTSEETELSQDRIYDILSSSRRRYILLQLKQREQPVELTELAEELAAWENDTTVAELSKEDRKRVYVSLYQTHVPKLDEAGLIEYDSDSGLVSLRSDVTVLDSYLPSSDDDETEWYRIYIAAAALNGLFILAAITGVIPVGQFVASVVVVASFLALTVAHAVSARRSRSDAGQGNGPH
jgi:hypothetical protein